MPSGKGSIPRQVEDQPDRGQYPINHVLAILATPDQTSCAVDALVNGGMLGECGARFINYFGRLNVERLSG
jgi:hypothetical protein